MTQQPATAVHVRGTIPASPELATRLTDQVGPGWESALDALVPVGC